MAIQPELFAGTKINNWGATAGTSNQTPIAVQVVLNEHVDVRTFEPNISVPRLMSSIDTEMQGAQGDTDPATLDETTMLDLDQQVTVPGEGWTITATTGLQQNWTDGGVSAANYLYTGNIPTRSNWLGAKMLCNGSNLNVTLQSSFTTVAASPINISNMDYLTLVMPALDPSQVNTATSYVQLSSNIDGTFTGTTGRVFFSAEAANGLNAFLKELRVPVTNFTGIDLQAITGVRIHVETTSAPANNTSLIFMAVRAIKNTWVYKTLDVNTKTGRYVQAVNPTGIDPTATDKFTNLVRTSGTADPKPTDASLLMWFNSGRLAIANGANFNQIDLIFREVTSNATNGSYLVARISFNNAVTKVSYFHVQVINGVVDETAGAVVFTSGTPNGPPVLGPFNPGTPDSGWYLFKADVHDSTITTFLYQSDASNTVGVTPMWSNSAVARADAANFTPAQGRVGFFAKFFDYDVQLDTWQAAATAFSSFTTKVFASHTPVDGAQLVATYSGDANLFSSFNGADVVIDTNRSLSADGSYKASNSLYSNLLFVEDWKYTYLDFDIFTLVTTTTASQPVMYLKAATGGGLIPLLTSSTQAPSIVPYVGSQNFNYGQWTHVTIPLAQLGSFVTGFYQVVVAQPNNTEQTTWWIDNMRANRQTMEWEMKASAASANWRPFGTLVNDPDGALHLPRDERGTELQLQCRALTSDAWVSSFTLTPHYAELGRPVYYQIRVTDG